MDRRLHNALIAQYATPSVSGDGRAEWDGGVKCVMPSVMLYGAATQDGTPTPDAPIMPVCNDGEFRSIGNTILGTTKLNVNSFGWTQNFDNEFGLGAGYYYHQVRAKPNTTYLFVAPYAAKDVGTMFYTKICKNRSGDGIWIFHADIVDLQNKTGKIKTDDSGYLYIVTTSFYEDRNVLRYFFLTEWDGGQATAPELWAIPGMDIRDEWDAQTGWGVRRCKIVTFDGSESNWKSESYVQPNDKTLITYGSNPHYGVLSNGCYGLCNCMVFDKNGQQKYSFKIRNFNSISFTVPVDKYPEVDAFVSDIAQWAAMGDPLTVVVPAETPVPFYHPPARLTMPGGFGQIIQTSGSVPDCQITAKFLTHS